MSAAEFLEVRAVELPRVTFLAPRRGPDSPSLTALAAHRSLGGVSLEREGAADFFGWPGERT